MKVSSKVEGVIFMSSWNTDGGVSRHVTPIAYWMIKNGYKVKVLTHYRETPHGFNLEVEDEGFVERCYTLRGEKLKDLPSFNRDVLLRTLDEGYNVFVAEDLGMLPMEELLEIFPKIKEKAKTVLVNHDNIPKSEDSIFWKFDWDAVINFLPEQMDFMKEHYPEDKLYLVEFPAYPKPEFSENKEKLREFLSLPKSKKIILLFGEYDFVDPFDVLKKYRKDNEDVFLLLLLYSVEQKNEISKILLERFGELYDDMRIEVSTWERRAQYVMASDLVVLDKGRKKKGEGAVLSSTAFQIIGWGTPIIARKNKYFDVFDGFLETYKDDAEMLEKIGMVLEDSKVRSNLLEKQNKFYILHTPERISSKFVWVLENL